MSTEAVFALAATTEIAANNVSNFVTTIIPTKIPPTTVTTSESAPMETSTDSIVSTSVVTKSTATTIVPTATESQSHEIPRSNNSTGTEPIATAANETLVIADQTEAYDVIATSTPVISTAVLIDINDNLLDPESATTLSDIAPAADDYLRLPVENEHRPQRISPPMVLTHRLGRRVEAAAIALAIPTQPPSE